ncbi:hypothetical protein GCM10010430_24040 [Kitasatospora cystarginea]|uniref:Uncharacterized protein n=1 Tax=Kitasatospora cystarginea TaxID=58350 RepID=A0ABN3DVW8_9ACTN
MGREAEVMNPVLSLTPAQWRRVAVATLLGSPLALVSVLYARWADFRYVDIPLGNCLDSPGLPLAARLAACGGGLSGSLS